MYLLDTNLVSELRKTSAGRANRGVAEWQLTAAPNTLFLSVITLMELELGTLRVERRDPLQGQVIRKWLLTQVIDVFGSRILVVDAAVALRCAKLHVPDPKPERDALIAATALVHGMAVVTRNVADFKSTGVKTINPWTV